MNQSKHMLYAVTTLALAIFTMGCLVILFVFVPMWLESGSREFLQWFARHGKTIGAFMLPLELIPLLLSLIAYIRSSKAGKPFTTWLLLTNSCNFLILGMFILYFLPLNSAFMNGTMPVDQVPEALKEWQLFHIYRTILSLLAVIFSGIAYKASLTTIRNKEAILK
jgi:hypothetical protein